MKLKKNLLLWNYWANFNQLCWNVCSFNLPSVSYSFWNKGRKVLKFWKFDEKREITPKWVRGLLQYYRVIRRKLFQKSSLKVLDQWKPNLVWFITRVSSFKIVSSDAVHQPTKKIKETICTPFRKKNVQSSPFLSFDTCHNVCTKKNPQKVIYIL
jgi:hypothetical protein